MKLTKQERLAVLRTHGDKTVNEVAAILNVSPRTVERDKKSLRPDVPDADGPVSDDPVTNLRAQQQHLRESLKVLAIGSENYRKTLGSISALEVSIAKLTKPSTDATDWEFICYLDSHSGFATTRRLRDCPDDVKARLEPTDNEWL